MFTPPNDPNEEYYEKLAPVIEKLQEEARKIGLYVSAAFLQPDPMTIPGEKTEPRIIVTFAVGDVAFSDRVQNPEQDEVEDQFRGIEHGMVRDQVEEIKGSGRDLLASLRDIDNEDEEEEEPDGG